MKFFLMLLAFYLIFNSQSVAVSSYSKTYIETKNKDCHLIKFERSINTSTNVQKKVPVDFVWQAIVPLTWRYSEHRDNDNVISLIKEKNIDKYGLFSQFIPNENLKLENMYAVIYQTSDLDSDTCTNDIQTTTICLKTFTCERGAMKFISDNSSSITVSTVKASVSSGSEVSLTPDSNRDEFEIKLTNPTSCT